MALYTTLHLHNVPDAQGADYAAWFDGAHRVSLSRLRGFVAADRYEIADAQLGDAFEPHRYLSVYDFDYNSPEIDLPAPGVPADLAAALAAVPAAQATFAAFPPSQRREYIEWITEAKRDDTRQRRLAQAVEWMAEGKPRNWKYTGC